MQNTSDVLTTYARTIHTVELHIKFPRKALHIMHIIPLCEDLA